MHFAENYEALERQERGCWGLCLFQFRVLNPRGGLSCHGLGRGERVGNSCGDGFGPGTRLTGTGREEACSQVVCRSCPEPSGGESFFPFCFHTAPFSRSEFWSLLYYIGSPTAHHCAAPPSPSASRLVCPPAEFRPFYFQPARSPPNMQSCHLRLPI